MEYYIKTPVSEEEVRRLEAGDVVYISGKIITGRDQVHRRALEFYKEGKPLPVDLRGMAIYHCGPIAEKKGDEWRIVGFGPTTSARMESVEADFLRAFGVRLVIGKGGMFERTTQAMKELGAAYLAHPGGVSVLATKSVKRVLEVHWLDLGIPEAMWVVEVENFGPTMVAIDSHGRNLFMEVMKRAESRRKEIFEELK